MLGMRTDNLLQINNPEAHDAKYFAMLNNGVAVNHTEFDGGTPAKAFKYYEYLLKLKLPNCPVDFNIDRELLDVIEKHITDLSAMQTLLDEMKAAKTLLTPLAIEKIIKRIQSQISATGTTYFPSGWMGNPGHFAVLKLRLLDNGHYAASLINHGGGIQYHRKLFLNNSKDKYIYQSDEYEVDLNVYDGQQFIQHLCELTFDLNRELDTQFAVSAYSEEDLYPLLEFYSIKKIPLTEKLNEKLITPQRGGTCTITNTHAVARDVLIDKNADLKTRKRYHFVVKLRSIIEGFSAYTANRYPFPIMEWALREFAVRVNKEYHHTLSDKEMTYCTELHALIQNKLNADQAFKIKKRCAVVKTPASSGEVILTQDFKKIVTEKPNAKSSVSANDGNQKLDHILKIKPNEFLKLFSWKNFSDNFQVLYQQLNALPHCTGLPNDPYWGEVPAQHIPAILERLLNVAETLSPTSSSPVPQVRAQCLLLVLRIYDIAAQLAMRCGETHLGDRFTLALDDIYSQSTFFNDPTIYYAVKRIASNFELRAQGKQRIFSNAVNYANNEFDQTIPFLIRELLTQKQREFVSDSLMRARHASSANYTDEQLFAHLINNLYMTDGSGNIIVPKAVQSLLKISSIAHSSGLNNKRYVKNENSDIYLFVKTQFHRELERQMAANTHNESKHLPFSSGYGGDFCDFSENTLYHPKDNLAMLRDLNAQTLWRETTYTEAARLNAYQLYPSGSLLPSSTVWNVTNTPQNLYEKWDEDFRHLTCAPNLQISRVFAWVHSNPGQLKHSIVRTRVEELIFEYGKLDLTLNHQFEPFIHNAQKFFATVIQFCKEEAPQDIEMLHWAAILACDIQDYIKIAITNNSELQGVRVTLPSFLPILLARAKDVSNAELRGKLANTIVRNFKDFEAFSVTEACLALTFRIAAMMTVSGDDSDNAWEQMHIRILTPLQGSAISKKLNYTLYDYLQFTAVDKWRLENNRLIGDDGKFEINLTTGTLENHNNAMIDCTEQAFLENKDLFASLALTADKIRLFRDNSSNKIETFDGLWQFQYIPRTQTLQVQQTTHLKKIENTQIPFEYLHNSEVDRTILHTATLFESVYFFNAHYRYWVSTINKNLIFVEQIDGKTAYLLMKDKNDIVELALDQAGVWQMNGNILFNYNSHNEWTRQWLGWKSELFGLRNVRWKLSPGEEKDNFQLKSIEHLTLGLKFTFNMQGQLICEQFPGYHLPEQHGLPELQGIESILILENQRGHRKYLIPAYQFSESNNAVFSYQDDSYKIFETGKFCNPSQPYYLYTMNRHSELVGQSTEATLYLALIHRSLGDFKKAFTNLARCETHQTISPASFAIALQVLQRKIQSPIGAAFDLKLQCYLVEHQNKWEKTSGHAQTPIQFTENWNKWITQQRQFYHNTVSTYKDDVAILPSYSRLSPDEFLFLYGERVQTAARENLAWIPGRVSKRVAQCARLPDIIFNHDLWEKHVQHLKQTSIREEQANNNFVSMATGTLRYIVKDHEAPASHYIVSNFNGLYDSMFGDTKQAKRWLYALLQNDRNPRSELFELIALLQFAHQFRETFPREKLHHDPFVRLEQIGAFVRKYEHFKKVSLYLLDDPSGEVSLSLPQPLPGDHHPHAVRFELSTSSLAAECEHPLGKSVTVYFTANEVPIASGDFALRLSDMPDATPLEKRLLNQYKKGHEENQAKTKAVYQIKGQMNIQYLKTDLERIKKSDANAVAKLESTLLKLANKTPLDSSNIAEKSSAQNLLMAQASEQKSVITISDLFSALLQKNPKLLTEQNPFLTQADVNQILIDLSSYALLQSRIDQINQIMEVIDEKQNFDELDSFQLQSLASALDKHRAYNPAEYPEFLIYEYATKRLLRPDQVATLIKVIALIETPIVDDEQMQHCLLQFAAGGGKTSVLVPILAQRFAQSGYMPVIFNTNELYQISIEDIPNNLRLCFQQNMEVVECDLDHMWTDKELAKLLTDLRKWREDKKCLLLKPVTWHSINLSRKLSYLQRGRTFNLANYVLDFFKNECVKLEDECQLVSDPLQQSIKTFGRMQKIPAGQIELLLKFYKYLMGLNRDSEEICQLAGIKSRKKNSISAPDLKELQTKLAAVIAKEPFFKDVNRAQLLQYLTQKDKQRPQWLLDLHAKRVARPQDDDDNEPPFIATQPDRAAKDLADLIILARAFIQTHLPHIVTLQYKKDYGPSIHPGDLTVAPKHEGKDVTSHFGDHTLVEALTIQMYSQNGLSNTQVEQLLADIVKLHYQERNWNHHPELPTQAESWLLTTIPLDYSFTCCRDLTATLKQKLSHDRRFCTHPQVIEKYLLSFALPQIKVPQQKQTSTASELQAGFSRSVLLSATPGLPETYPAFLRPEHCFLEEAFEAQVIDTLLQVQNSGVCVLNRMQTPNDFFQQFPADLLGKMTTLIDRGALLTEFEGMQVVSSYLGLDAESKKTQTAAFFSKEHMHLTSTDKSIKNMQIPGASLVDALKKQGIEPEKFLLFLFLDLSKTTGTDIKRPPQDHAGLTVGKGQTVTETIQAAMRERQLLDKNAQSVTWLMFASLYNEIHPNENDDSFDARTLFYWMLKNEAKQIETKIIERAYQGIDQALKDLVWKSIANAADDEFIYKLRQLQELSPWDIYEINSKTADTTTVLRKYVASVSTFLSENNDRFFIPKHVHARIDLIIKQTSALISTLNDPPKKSVNAQVQQELQTELTEQLEQQQQQTLKKKIESVSGFVFAMESYRLDEDNLQNIFDSQAKDKLYAPLQLSSMKNLKTPELLLRSRHFSPLQMADSKAARELEMMKPIKIVLLKIHHGKLRYAALTAAGGEYYSFVLNNQSLRATDPCYALITIEGDVLCTTNNLTVVTCAQMIARNDCQRMLSYAVLLNGTINNPIILSEFIKEQGWTQQQFTSLAQQIGEVQVSVSSEPLLNHPVLYELCGWQSKENTLQPSNPRYKQPQLLQDDKAFHTLRPLKEGIDSGLPLIPTPKRALAGYLFSETPRPVARKSEEFQLAMQIVELESMHNIHNIPGKDFALGTLRQSCQLVINSVLPVPEKLKLLQERIDEFVNFDKFLDDLNEKLMKFSPMKNLAAVSASAQTAIKNAYIQFAKGLPIAACKKQFKESLHEILQTAEEKSPHMRFFGKTVALPKVTNDPLAEVLKKAEKSLEDLADSSTSTNSSVKK